MIAVSKKGIMMFLGANVINENWCFLKTYLVKSQSYIFLFVRLYSKNPVKSG